MSKQDRIQSIFPKTFDLLGDQKHKQAERAVIITLPYLLPNGFFVYQKIPRCCPLPDEEFWEEERAKGYLSN